MRAVAAGILGWISVLLGLGLTVVVALQTSKSEGLSGILAGGGGGGGKVGRARHLESLGLYLAYTWLVLVALTAIVRPA